MAALEDQVEEKLADPQPAGDDAGTVDPPGAKVPGWAAAGLGLLGFVVLVVFLWRGWDYVVGTGEAAEKEDYEQLLGLIDRVDTLVTLVLGAVLGFGVGGATAASAAGRNKAAAEKMRTVATANAEAAARNRKVATALTADLAVAADLGTAVDRVARQRQQDGSRFVGPAQVAKAEPTSGGYALDAAGTLELAAAPALAPYDPLLEPLQERAAALRERLDRWG